MSAHNERFDRLLKRSSGRRRRNRDQIAPTVKSVERRVALDHLADKARHDSEVPRQKKWARQQRLRKASLDEDVEESRLYGEALAETGFAGSSGEDELFGGSLKSKGDIEGLMGRTGLVMSCAYLGPPGRRVWQDLEGEGWSLAMLRERKIRSRYVTRSRNHHSRTKNALQCIFGRLPPWTAEELGPRLLDDPAGLRKRVQQLAKEFEDRYDVDVLGAVVHRESEFDLHVHLVFSRSREKVIPRKVSARQLQKHRQELNSKAREELRAAGKTATNRAVSERVRAKLASGEYPQTEDSEERVEYRRYDDLNPEVRRNTMGHAFRCKYQTWEIAANQDKDDVAALRDREPWQRGYQYSFRYRILNAGGEVDRDYLEEYWWDLWMARRWDSLCREGFSAKINQEVDARGQKMARDFIRYGSTKPSTEERLLVEKKELSRQLEEGEKQCREQVIELERLKGEIERVRADLDTERARSADLEREVSRLRIVVQDAQLPDDLGKAIAAIPERWREMGQTPADAVVGLKSHTLAFEESAFRYQKALSDLIGRLLELMAPGMEQILAAVAVVAEKLEMEIPKEVWEKVYPPKKQGLGEIRPPEK